MTNLGTYEAYSFAFLFLLRYNSCQRELGYSKRNHCF